MSKQPLHVVYSQIRRLSLPAQIHELRKLAKLEPEFSIRRNELESLLKGKVAKQLKREMRAA